MTAAGSSKSPAKAGFCPPQRHGGQGRSARTRHILGDVCPGSRAVTGRPRAGGL